VGQLWFASALLVSVLWQPQKGKASSVLCITLTAEEIWSRWIQAKPSSRCSNQGVLQGNAVRLTYISQLFSVGSMFPVSPIDCRVVIVGLPLASLPRFTGMCKVASKQSATDKKPLLYLPIGSQELLQGCQRISNLGPSIPWWSPPPKFVRKTEVVMDRPPWPDCK
jgi:hypothetical protein